MPEGIDADLLDKLSVALFTIHSGDELNASRNLKYIHIIFAMTKKYEWCQRLASHGHLQRCISLVTANGVQMYERDVGFYLTVVIGRLYYKDSRFDSHPTQSHPWWTLVRNTWIHAHLSVGDVDYIDGIPTLVIAIKSGIFSGERPPDIAKKVQEALEDLQKPGRQATFAESGITPVAVETAISSVQDLYKYLGGTVEQPKTS